MVRFTVAALLLVTASAFVVTPPGAALHRPAGAVGFRLHAAAEESSSQESAETKEPVVEDDEKEEEEVEEEEEEEEEEEKEDPEVTALKQEIADLESALKAKQNELSYQADQLDRYSKGGYARKVAEMETMRRNRSAMNSSSREAAMASVVQNFLPIQDLLDSLQEKYGEDDFGKKYNALAGAMRTSLKGLGAQEYTVEVGAPVDTSRMVVVEEEYSEQFPKGTVIRPVAMGMELQGNVMRMAECVASLGTEEVEEEESEGDDEESEGDDEEAEEEKDEASKED